MKFSELQGEHLQLWTVSRTAWRSRSSLGGVRKHQERPWAVSLEQRGVPKVKISVWCSRNAFVSGVRELIPRAMLMIIGRIGSTSPIPRANLVTGADI